MDQIFKLFEAMVQYEKGAAGRIQHFTKVYTYCDLMAKKEGLSALQTEILLSAALVHDCGIRPSLEKYDSSAGSYQQIEGPSVAKELLQKLEFDDTVIERVCYLVAHHHTYHDIVDLDYQILVEADFLVNILEDKMDKKQIESIRTRIFKTETGTWLLDTMFLDA